MDVAPAGIRAYAAANIPTARNRLWNAPDGAYQERLTVEFEQWQEVEFGQALVRVDYMNGNYRFTRDGTDTVITLPMGFINNDVPNRSFRALWATLEAAFNAGRRQRRADWAFRMAQQQYPPQFVARDEVVNIPAEAINIPEEQPVPAPQPLDDV